MPAFVAPQLATLVDQAPAGADWVHEIKLDGYRILTGVANGRARLWTRSGLDWSDRFPRLAEDLANLETASALLDGEVVALDASGRSSFQALQRALGESDGDLVYFVFDLLALDGGSLRPRPLAERKAALAGLLERSTLERVRLSDHVAGQGEEFFRHACELGVEGVVSKRADAPYRSGRHRDWLKTKCSARQEFVIGAYTEPQGSRAELGALLVGSYQGDELRYAGKVGTGFDAATLAELKKKLRPLEQRDPSFVNPPRGADARGVHWVRPRLVAEVSFTEWTADGRLRHPTFRGLREDKSAREVRRESPASPAAEARAARGGAGAKPKVAPPGEPAVAGITLSNPGRVYFPERGLTKLDLASYYEAVAERMLPHIAGRPLTLVRCPQGRGKHCFYQKHLREDAPPAVRSVEIREGSGGAEPYPYVSEVAGLVALVQLGVLEFHGWGARADDVERPDRLVFDLDPDEGLEWRAVTDAAVELRRRLQEAGLDSWLQTTGGKGLHVVAPITRRYGWDEVKPFCRGIAEAMVGDSPARYVSKASKAARRGKIFLDWLRNGRGATAIMPYSSRARPNATVALPISWREVTRVDPASFTIESVPGRLAGGSDPWGDFLAHRQQLTRAALRQVVS
jgi:bifunctional non-homologous end joining protein LigD